MSTSSPAARLAELVAEFEALIAADRLQLLVELGDEVPALPERFRERPELLEQVVECQSPVYLRAEFEDGAEPGSGAEPVVRLHITAAPQAPVTRGFAGVLHLLVDGSPAREVLDLPADVGARLGLAGTVSPLRLQGLAGMLGRVRRQITERLA